MILKLKLSVVDSATSDCLDNLRSVWRDFDFQRSEPAQGRIIFHLSDKKENTQTVKGKVDE
jgi:hypothetical protein